MAAVMFGENIDSFIDRITGQRNQTTELLLGRGNLILGHQRQPAGVVPHRAQHRAERRRLGLVQHSSQRPNRVSAKYGTMRNRRSTAPFFSVSSSIFARVAAPTRSPACSVLGGRREPEEVDVVRVVGHRVQALRTALADVILVSGDRQLIALIASAYGRSVDRCGPACAPCDPPPASA